MEEYDSRFNTLKQINKDIMIDDEAYKRDMYKKERNIETVNKEKYVSKNKYSETLSKMSVTTKNDTSNYEITQSI